MVTPSYFLAILDEMEAQGVDPRSTSLEIGIFGAEPWTDEMRHEVERRSGIKAVDIYGLSEVMGPGVSQEAVETQDGLHVWEDHFYPEIIDPVTGEVLPDGEEGELVFTSLTKQAMPVIRYRTRDLTRLLPGTAYPAFRRMQKVTGRTDDMMIVRGVNVFPTMVEEQILKVEGLTPHYLCVLTRPGNLDELTVRVEAHESVAEADREALGPPAGRARQGQRRHDGPGRGARAAQRWNARWARRSGSPTGAEPHPWRVSRGPARRRPTRARAGPRAGARAWAASAASCLRLRAGHDVGAGPDDRARTAATSAASAEVTTSTPKPWV